MTYHCPVKRARWYWRHAKTPEAIAWRNERDAERVRLSAALVRYRRVEWDNQYDVVATADGEEIRVARPWWRRHAGPSPLVTHAEPVPRTRTRGSYTRSLVLAATRGHDHVPRRPT